MSHKRGLMVGVAIYIITLSSCFFLSVRFGAKLHYYQESSFSAFKTMRDLEALRADNVEAQAIKALIKEKEADLDADLMSVSSYQKSKLIWLGFLLKHSDDAIFLRSIADYRWRYPAAPMDTTALNVEQRQAFVKFYLDAINEQKLLLEKYR